MLALLTTVHVLVAVFLILVVLLQSARGTDLAGAFGGMGSQAAFGPRGTATFLSKATIVLATIFGVTSLSLAILANRSRGAGGESVLSGEPTAPAGQTAPAPATPTPVAPGAAGTPIQVEGLPPGMQVVAEPVPGTPPAQSSPAPAPAASQPAAPAAPSPNP